MLWYLGEPEESLERSDTSLSLEERVGGPVTRAQAWGMRSLLHLARSELDELGRWIERAHAHSTEYNVGYWRALSSLLAGGCRRAAASSRPAAGASTTGLQAYLRSGALLGLSRFYVLRAGLCGWPATGPGRSPGRRGRRAARRRRPASATRRPSCIASRAGC